MLQTLLCTILMSMFPLASALLIPLPKINSQLATMTPHLPPHDLWHYIELGPSLSSLPPYLMPTPCSPGMMMVEQTQLEITWWTKCLQTTMIALQSQLYMMSPSLSDIDVLY